jgi:hypothetical protein
MKWLYASHGRRLVDPRLEAGFLRRLTIRYVGSFVLYLSAVVLKLVDYRWGLALATGLTLLYLLPPPSPVYVDEERAVERPPHA